MHTVVILHVAFNELYYYTVHPDFGNFIWMEMIISDKIMDRQLILKTLPNLS